MVESEISQENGLLLIALLNLTLFLFLLIWFWTLGTELNNKINKALKPKSLFFKTGIFLCALFQIIFLVDIIFKYPLTSIEFFFFIFFLLKLFFFFFIFYAAYFISRNLVIAEKCQSGNSKNIILTLCLFLCFFPVGVWFLQRRINKVMQI
jgi:hypothetical protein